MSGKHGKINTTTKYIIAVCALMLATNIILGAILTNLSVRTMRYTMNDSMIAVSKTATSFIDAEELKTLTEDDAPVLATDENGDLLTDENGDYIVTEECSQKYDDFVRILDKIIKSQNNVDVKYIYLVARNEEKSTAEHGVYYFTIDPDESRPAPWGKEVVFTPAQDIAWNGTTAVDAEPYEDEWGKYYTAWSPVKDDGGTVISLVGVDFDAKAIEQTLYEHLISVLIFTLLTIAVSAAIIVVFSVHLRKRFAKLSGELTTLSSDLETLFSEIDDTNVPLLGQSAQADAYTIESLSQKATEMQRRLKEHLGFMQKQADTDYMTSTGNFRAYHNAVEDINCDIENGNAAFALALFDINRLKQMNDTHGHEYGNALITTAANTIKDVFGSNNVYRIGGDEFIAILKGVSEREVESLIDAFQKEIKAVNDNDDVLKNGLSVSIGYAVYSAEKNDSFQTVFDNADQSMYSDKERYYQKNDRWHDDPRTL